MRPRRLPSSIGALAVGFCSMLAPGACRSDGAGTTSSASSPDRSIPRASTTASATTSATTSTSSTMPRSTMSSSTTSSSTTTSTTAAPTTTLRPLVIDGAVVLVANAAGVVGAGAQLTAVLADIGFSVRDPTNAAGAEEVLDVSHVYYVPGAEAVAESIAFLMGDDIAIARMPTPPPVVGALEGLGEATVLVMLGRDLAGKQIPGRR